MSRAPALPHHVQKSNDVIPPAIAQGDRRLRSEAGANARDKEANITFPSQSTEIG